VQSQNILPFPKFGTGDNVFVILQCSIAFGTVTQKLSFTGSKTKKPEWRFRINGKHPKIGSTSAPFLSEELEPFFQKGDIVLYTNVVADRDPEISVGVITEPYANGDFWSLELKLVSLLQMDASSTVVLITKDITTKRSSNISKVVCVQNDFFLCLRFPAVLRNKSTFLFDLKVTLFPFEPGTGPAPPTDAIYVHPCVHDYLSGLSLSLKAGCTKPEVPWPVFTSRLAFHVLCHAGLTAHETAIPFLIMSPLQQVIKGKPTDCLAGFKGASSNRSFVPTAQCVPSLVEASTEVFEGGNLSNTGGLVVKSYVFANGILKVHFENHAPVELDSAREETFFVRLSFPCKVSTAFHGTVEDGIFFSAQGKFIVAVHSNFARPWEDKDKVDAIVSESPGRKYKFLVYSNCNDAARVFIPV